MSAITPYLFFDGNCREAMSFYKKALGGELEIMTFGDGPPEASAKMAKDQVMHACLKSGDLILMASDSPDGAPSHGDSVYLSLNCDSLDQIERSFKAMSEGGKVITPLENTFWGARFGMVTDRYGFNWMFNCELKK